MTEGTKPNYGRETIGRVTGWERVLVLAPHTDDGEFGCGGTMARLVDAGADVRYVAFSIATKSLPEGFAPDTLAREVREATAELGIQEESLTVHDFEVRTFPERRQDILELLIGLWEEWRPDAVFQPSLHDIHQDHQVVAAEGDSFVEMRIEKPFPMQVRYTLEDAPEGTRAKIRARGEPGGFFKVAAPFMKRMVRKNIGADLALLKTNLEAT